MKSVSVITKLRCLIASYGPLTSLWDWFWGRYKHREPAMTPPGIKLRDLHNHARGSLCKACDQYINEEYVMCRQCGAPHHRSCWENKGSCSTVGCKSKKVRLVA